MMIICLTSYVFVFVFEQILYRICSPLEMTDIMM